jgi:hypothetical protein
MIHLPSHPSRACLIAFWLSFSLGASVVAALLLYLLVSPQHSGLGLLSVPTSFLPILFWPKGLILCYRIWNRLAREISRFAQKVILRICFHVVFVAAGFAGSSMRIDRLTSKESLWTDRETVSSNSYFGEHKVSAKRSPTNWLSSVFSWSQQSGDLLPLCLLPFLLLLRILEPKQETTVPSDIYTLF